MNIEITEDIRINDYDSNQYTLEIRRVAQTGKNVGEVKWNPIAYCGTNKALVGVLREYLVDEARNIAAKAVRDQFDNETWEAEIMALPKKDAS